MSVRACVRACVCVFACACESQLYSHLHPWKSASSSHACTYQNRCGNLEYSTYMCTVGNLQEIQDDIQISIQGSIQIGIQDGIQGK